MKLTGSVSKDPPITEIPRMSGRSLTDYGTFGTSVGALKHAVSNNWTSTFYHFVTKPEGGKTLSEEEFNNTIAPYYGLEWKEGITEYELDWQVKRKAKQTLAYDQSVGASEGLTSASTFLASAIFLDPVNYPLMLLSGGTSNAAKLATFAGKPAKASALATRDQFLKLWALNSALDIPYAYMRQGIGEEFTADMFATQLAFNTAFSGAFAARSGYKHHQIANTIKHNQRKYQEFKNFMDQSKAAGQYNYSDILNFAKETGNPKIVELIESNQRLNDIANGRIKEEDITADDINLINSTVSSSFLNNIFQDISVKLADDYLNNLKNNPKVSSRKAYAEYKTSILRIQKAIESRDMSLLTSQDKAWLRKYASEAFPKSTSKSGEQIFKQLPHEKRSSYQVAYNLYRNKATDLATEADNIIKAYRQNNYTIVDKKRVPVTSLEEFTAQDKVFLEKNNELLKKEFDSIMQNSPATKIRNEVVEFTEQVINKHFLGKKTNIEFSKKHPLEYYGKYNNKARGVYDFSTGEISIGPAALFDVNPSYSSQIINTAMHEFVHALRYIPEAAQLQTIANEIAKTSPALDAEILRRNYNKKDLITERAPVLMEWAITRPEFWNVLAKKDKLLHDKLHDSAMDFMRFMQQYLRGDESSRIFVTEMDNLQKSQPIAERLGKAIELVKRDSEYNNILKDVLEYNKQHTGSEIAEQMARPAYENPNIKARVAELERFNADPKQYLTDEIVNLLGDETILPILMTLPKLSKGTQGRKEHIVKTQQTLIEKGYDNLAAKYETILLNLQGSKSRQGKSLKIIKKNPTNEELVAELNSLNESGTPPETLSRIGYILLDSNTTAAQKIGKVNKFFEQEDLAMILRFVHNDSIRTSLNTQAKIGSGKKARLAQLKTMLDGSLRADVSRGPSIQKYVEAQIIKDQSPLIDYLAKNDLTELFFGEDVSKYMSKYLGKKVDQDGTSLIEGSKALHKLLMQSILEGSPVGRIKDIPELEGLVDVIKTINRGQLAEINRLGINVRESKNFTGYSVRYDRDLVASMSKDQFVDYMMKVADLKETARLHGNVMNKFTSGGEADGVQVFQPKPFFERMYKEIIDGTFIDDGTTANKSIAGAMRKSSKIAIREQVKPEVLVKFSNFQNLGRLLFNQIRSRAEKIALIKNLGHDPYTMLMDVAKDLQLTKTPGFKTFDWTAKQISGMLDNPVDAVFAKNFQKVRGVSNLLYLPTASISALSDIPLAMTTLDYLGAKVPFSKFAKIYARAFKMAFKGSDKEMAAFFKAQGAGFDLLTRTIGQRVVTGEPLATDLLGKSVQVMFEFTALNPITATHQIMFIDVLSSGLAVELKAMKKDSITLARMREFGFTNAELEHLAKHIVETPDGIERSAPSNIPNAKIQAKLQAFYLQYMKEAVMEPDAGAQAITRLGTESGTFKGETIRTAFQYSSFMLGMSRVVYRRFAHGYSGEGQHNAFAMSHLIAYIGCAIGFAYISTVLKDVSRGKEPIDITNMSQFDFNRIISQSGILGIGDLAFNAVRFKDPTAFFSPVAGQAVDLATGDLESFIKPFKGEQYPILGPVMQQAVGFVAGETVNAVQSDLEENLLDTE